MCNKTYKSQSNEPIMILTNHFEPLHDGNVRECVTTPNFCCDMWLGTPHHMVGCLGPKLGQNSKFQAWWCPPPPTWYS